MGRKGVHAREASQADLALSGAGAQRSRSAVEVNLLPLRGDEMMMEGEA